MKLVWIARKEGEIPRIAKYASSLFELQRNGFTLERGKRPKKYIYIAVK